MMMRMSSCLKASKMSAKRGEASGQFVIRTPGSTFRSVSNWSEPRNELHHKSSPLTTNHFLIF